VGAKFPYETWLKLRLGGLIKWDTKKASLNFANAQGRERIGSFVKPFSTPSLQEVPAELYLNLLKATWLLGN
jgi:hypothetical protein